MTMTTRSKRRQPVADSGTVTVRVIEPHLVFHDGEQRGGTLHDVPADAAAYWEHHGWVTIVADEPKAPNVAEQKAKQNDE